MSTDFATRRPEADGATGIIDNALSRACNAVNRELAPHQLDALDENLATARFHAHSLASVFQPIVHAQDRKTFGAEAFVRAGSGTAAELSPASLFSRASDGDEVVRLDRLCRALHVANFGAGFVQKQRLFLNVHPELPEVVKADFGVAFRRILALFGRRAETCVLEMRWQESSDPRLLGEVFKGFRARGFGIALDLGDEIVGPARAALAAGRFQADFLKFTPSGAVATDADLLQRQQAGGARLIATRVGDVGALALAATLGADFLQGHMLARPSARLQ